ncbi:MAG: hypothetical protein KKB31_05275 [Nanoarchaeota archaeon]|nr:hypothetical protein [Nanoarchaeota archaeon]
MKDHSEEFRILIEKYKERGLEYGKPKEYIEFRNSCSIEELEKALLEFKDLKFVERQVKEGEKRYKTYHVYSSKRGRVYVITFTDKIRIISIYPLSQSTVKRYHRAKFKK